MRASAGRRAAAAALAALLLAACGAHALAATAELADVRVAVSGGDEAQFEARFPSSVSSVVHADAAQRLTVSARVLGAGQPLDAQQAMLRLTHLASGEQTFYAPPGGAGKKGKKGKKASKARRAAGPVGSFTFTLALGDDRNRLQRRSGDYALHLVIGDSSLEHGLEYHVADAHLALPPPAVQPDPPLYHRTLTHESDTTLKALPEIQHQFRQPEHRPHPVVSHTFTAAVVGLFVLLLVGFLALGVNLRGFPSGAGLLWALGFHSSLAALLGLCVLYWLRLNMFQTLTYMAPLALSTAFFGHRLLRSLDTDKLRGKAA